jgi:hypothetical protein
MRPQQGDARPASGSFRSTQVNLTVPDGRDRPPKRCIVRRITPELRTLLSPRRTPVVGPESRAARGSPSSTESAARAYRPTQSSLGRSRLGVPGQRRPCV